MFAVIKNGGKQYMVSEGDLVNIEKIDGEKGSRIEFKDILMVANGEDVKVGTPLVEGVSIIGEIANQGKRKKIIIFKAKRRKGYRKKQGHRQKYTAVRIKEIKVSV